MKTFFGVSSDTPSNKRLKNGYTLYDWVMRQKGFPLFWGRTISGENAIDEEEIRFLRDKDCKVLLVVRELTEREVSATSGFDSAKRAIKALEALNITSNQEVAIIAEIKPEWSVNHNWMISFAQIISSHGFIPGFIGNTDSSKNFNFDRQCSHYVQATQDTEQYGAIYCATEPKCDGAPEEWLPFCPSALEPENMQLWACGETKFGNIKVDDIYAKDSKILEKMFERKYNLNEQKTV